MSDSEEEIFGYSDLDSDSEYIDDEQPFICKPICDGKIKNGCTGSCKSPPVCLCDRPGWSISSCPLHSG